MSDAEDTPERRIAHFRETNDQFFSRRGESINAYCLLYDESPETVTSRVLYRPPVQRYPKHVSPPRSTDHIALSTIGIMAHSFSTTGPIEDAYKAAMLHINLECACDRSVEIADCCLAYQGDRDLAFATFYWFKRIYRGAIDTLACALGQAARTA